MLYYAVLTIVRKQLENPPSIVNTVSRIFWHYKRKELKLILRMQISSYVMVDTIQISSVMSITRMQDDWVVVGKADVSSYEWTDMRKRASTRAVLAEIFQNCGNC